MRRDPATPCRASSPVTIPGVSLHLPSNHQDKVAPVEPGGFSRAFFPNYSTIHILLVFVFSVDVLSWVRYCAVCGSKTNFSVSLRSLCLSQNYHEAWIMASSLVHWAGYY